MLQFAAGNSSMRVAVLLLAAVVGGSLANVFSCGGFVKSGFPIDYSLIKVKLLTPEGHLKHEEEVNADNGYYMIPVYAKGSYSIRVVAPDGWFFEPTSFDFKLDGATDPCTKEEDINFSLSAFSIDGAVESGAGQGPVGLSLSLKQGDKVIATTTTTEGGKYRFQAAPGKYSVAASADSSVCVSHAQSTVDVTSAPVRVEPSLRISGYPVDISVVANLGQRLPLEGVDLVLISKHDPKLPNCVPSAASTECRLGKTDAKGAMRLGCLAPGEYDVRATKENIVFEPATTHFSVVAEQRKVEVTAGAFVAHGRVTVDGKKAAAGVEVVVDGQVVGKTDANGKYSIQRKSVGRVKVTARAPHTTFPSEESTVDLGHLTLKDLAVQKFELCGSVEVPAGGSAEALALVSTGPDASSLSIRPDPSTGEFCTFVAPGKYYLSAANAASSLSPRKVEVDVSTGPSLGHSFTHFKTDATVKITCLAACEEIVLSLISRSGAVVATATGAESATFKDVSPGKYTVRVPTGGRWCWEAVEQPLAVDQSRPTPVHFAQNGVNAHVALSHPAKIEWLHSEERALKGTVEGKEGVNDICLPAAGSYKIQQGIDFIFLKHALWIDSCLVFDRPSFTVVVPSDTRHESSALSAHVTGKVEGAAGAGTIKILVKSASGDREVTASSNGVFSFHEPLTSAGGKLTFTPQSGTHLFDPTSAVVPFDGRCIVNAAVFHATKGIFIDGSISPAVEGADVVAVHKKDANLVFKTTTDKAGKFRVGPVRVAADLAITATKDGYSITEGASHGHLASVKLSQLILTFEDKETGERLNDAVLHVRGGAGGEKAQHKVEKDGQIKLAALAPGTFIRAFLQEYEFEPSTVTVTMKEGEHDEKTMKGRRVAYSAWGVVREMSGAAVAEVAVEALSESCDQHQSETTTAADGTFRLRALKPGCTYRVGLRAQDGKASPPHCYPSSFNVKMTAQDVKGLEMVAAPVDEGVEVVVGVEVVGAVRPSLRVTIEREDTGHPVSVQTLPAPVNVAVVRNLSRDGAFYRVRVEAEKGSGHVAFVPVEETFVADKAVKVLQLKLVQSKVRHEVEISLSSIIAMLLFSGMTAFLLQPEWYIDYAKNLLVRFSNAPGSSSPGQKKRK